MSNVLEKKWDKVTEIIKEYNEIYHKIACHYNLSDSAFWVLYSLNEKQDACTQKELYEYLKLSKQTVNTTISNLEKLGYVKRVAEESGKVNKKTVLTPSGLEFINTTMKQAIEIEEKAFAVMNMSEVEMLVELLQKPLSILKKELKEKLDI